MKRQELLELKKHHSLIMSKIGQTNEGKELVKYLAHIAVKAPCFNTDPYKTAHNLGRQDYINQLIRELTADPE